MMWWWWCSVQLHRAGKGKWDAQQLTVSSGWYQDRRAFLRSLPSLATKVF